MNDPLIRLSRITEIFGRHYQASLEAGGANPERVLRLFTSAVIEDLKRAVIPLDAEAGMIPIEKITRNEAQECFPARKDVTNEEAIAAGILLWTHDPVTGKAYTWEQFARLKGADRVLRRARRSEVVRKRFEAHMGPMPA